MRKGNNEEMSEFGEYLKNIRKERKITLRQVSDELKISISYLSDIETGTKLPPNSKSSEYSDYMDKIINYYKLSDDERVKLLELADKDLVERGHVSNDISNYMGTTPMATVALRKAKENNISDEEWKKIIDSMINK